MPVLRLDRLEDTTLLRRLRDGFAGSEHEDVATSLATRLPEICRDASERMKEMPTLHGQYTLHDATHLLRVTELIAKVAATNLGELNPIELALLILAAHFHDVGMVLSPAEIESLKTDPEYRLFVEDWKASHPNLVELESAVADARRRSSGLDALESKRRQLLDAMMSDYVRQTHGRRSAEFIKQQYSTDPRWTVTETSLAPFVALLAKSHTRSTDYIKAANGFHIDAEIGPYRANLPFLAVLLRLGDILDLDRDRTPDTLYRTISFTSDISIREWEKHRSVEGWTISEFQIRFSMRFEQPEYERTARAFMDLIDSELAVCHTLIRGLPAGSTFRALDLPQLVDRSRIGPKDDLYFYHDLEFALSRDDVVRLFMTDQLYREPSLAVRELLQNSLDALRLRQALYKCAGATLEDLQVHLEHGVNSDGIEFVRCSDNGSGMDLGIVRRFLSNVGRSYYRSPEFELQRASFREAGVDFDPCSRFGIGFLSFLMLGDRVVVATRRDNGPDKGVGEPLTVEIKGVGGLFTIRKGDVGQSVGTTVTILSRRKPGFLDRWTDKVKLCATVAGYALATEFPIRASCSIPELEQELEVPTQLATRQTEVERLALRRTIILEQPFEDLAKGLRGKARQGFLADARGLPCLKNAEAKLAAGERTGRAATFELLDREAPKRLKLDEAICLDGILVAGQPGRDGRVTDIGYSGAPTDADCPYLLDVRGELKPVLTPARTYPQRYAGIRREPTWDRIREKVSLACGRIWEKVALKLSEKELHSRLWKLANAYSAWLPHMRSKVIWDCVAVPVLENGGSTSWVRLHDIGHLKMVKTEDEIEYWLDDDRRLRVPAHVERFHKKGYAETPSFHMRSLVLGMATLVLDSADVLLRLSEPQRPDRSPSEFVFRDNIHTYRTMAFSSETREAVSVEADFLSLNRDHPLVEAVLENRFARNRQADQSFAQTMATLLSSRTYLSEWDDSVDHQDRWKKMVAHKYLALDLSVADERVLPPYKIWRKSGGWTEVSQETLEEWSQMDVKTHAP